LIGDRRSKKKVQSKRRKRRKRKRKRKMIVLSTHAKGLILAIVAVLILTPDAVLVRKLGHLPNFVVMFYRNLIFSVCIFLYEILRFGAKSLIPNFRAIGWLGWVAGLVWGTTNILITYGFQSTAVANVLVIIASNPMFAALFSFVILKETVPWYTIAAGLVCFGAIVSIFYAELSGSPNASDVAGLLSALGAAIGMGLYFVLLRVIDTRLVTRYHQYPQIFKVLIRLISMVCTNCLF
jgi:drug/metabolite transporter (DMT)-like permease